MYPEKYRYTKEHEWIELGANPAPVGITHHAQEKLGDIVYVELPAVGAHFDTMQPFGTVESVKAVSEIYCPVAGAVIEVNTKLADDPALVNQDPHGGAWLIKLKPDNSAEAGSLLTAAQYQEFIRADAH